MPSHFTIVNRMQVDAWDKCTQMRYPWSAASPVFLTHRTKNLSISQPSLDYAGLVGLEKLKLFLLLLLKRSRLLPPRVAKTVVSLKGKC